MKIKYKIIDGDIEATYIKLEHKRSREKINLIDKQIIERRIRSRFYKYMNVEIDHDKRIVRVIK